MMDEKMTELQKNREAIYNYLDIIGQKDVIEYILSKFSEEDIKDIANYIKEHDVY